MQELEAIQNELYNFLDQNPGVKTFLDQKGVPANPDGLILAYIGAGEPFALDIANVASGFSSMDGTPQKADKISDFLQKAAQVILAVKGGRDAIKGNGQAPTPAEPVVVAPAVQERGILGIPKPIFIMLALVLALVLAYVALKTLKK